MEQRLSGHFSPLRRLTEVLRFGVAHKFLRAKRKWLLFVLFYFRGKHPNGIAALEVLRSTETGRLFTGAVERPPVLWRTRQCGRGVVRTRKVRGWDKGSACVVLLCSLAPHVSPRWVELSINAQKCILTEAPGTRNLARLYACFRLVTSVPALSTAQHSLSAIVDIYLVHNTPYLL